MSRSVDLDTYFERIEWGGATRPGYDTLAGLLGAHMAHIPFENLEVLLGRPVRLDLQALQSKLVRARRGGYCFEQATLFAAVLEQLGFVTVRHTARVVIFVPRHESPRTHMFLTVPLAEGTFVIDPASDRSPRADPSRWPKGHGCRSVTKPTGWRAPTTSGCCGLKSARRPSIAGCRRWRQTTSSISSLETTTRRRTRCRRS